jgi:hypothetical protein
MKNATYVDQCDTIRTLTEEEMAVVSGGSRHPAPRHPAPRHPAPRHPAPRGGPGWWEAAFALENTLFN